MRSFVALASVLVVMLLMCEDAFGENKILAVKDNWRLRRSVELGEVSHLANTTFTEVGRGNGAVLMYLCNSGSQWIGFTFDREFSPDDNVVVKKGYLKDSNGVKTDHLFGLASIERTDKIWVLELRNPKSKMTYLEVLKHIDALAIEFYPGIVTEFDTRASNHMIRPARRLCGIEY